jgi:3-hydroxyacyl-[acyl-carrier-protein] dehydratase
VASERPPSLPERPPERAAIEARIPHRPPFLFIDRIAELVPPRLEAGLVVAGRIATEWRVPEDGSWFAGHYPGHPVLPGVLIEEFCFQSAALLLAEGAPRVAAGAVPVLVGIDSARFRRIVRPGETLRATVTLQESVGSKRWLAGEVRAGDERVLSIRFAVAEVAAPRPAARTGGAGA